MKHAALEEVEVLHTNFDIDFSRQTSMKRVAIDSAMLSTLPELAQLEELVVVNIKEDVTEQLLRFSHISRLTLSGPNYLVSDLDTSHFENLEELSIDVTSYDGAIQGRRNNGKKSVGSLASSQSSQSSSSILSTRSAQATLTLSFTVNDTWTNESLIEAVCTANNAANVSSLTIRSTAANTKWFTLPSCIESWTALEYVTCNYCVFPNMTAIPNTTIRVWLTYAKRQWTQSMTGRVSSDSPFASYFDWSWLSNMPLLNTIIMTSCNINGTLPNEHTHATLSSLDLSGAFNPPNRFVGTISPDFFVRYPALSSVSINDNKLTGTIPYYGIEALGNFYATNNEFTHWPSFVTNATAGFGMPTGLTYIDLGANKMVEIPSQDIWSNLPSITHLYLGSNTNLSGPVPNIFNQTVPRTSSNSITMLDISSCNFSGPLPSIPENQISAYWSSFSGMLLHGNKLSGPIPSSWSNITLTWLYLAGNTGLTGTIAQIDSSTGALSSPLIKDVQLFSISGEGLTGPMFNVSAMSRLRRVTVEGNNLDFCGTARLVVASNASAEGSLLFPSGHSAGFTWCTLTNTNATYCPWAYPSVCEVSRAPVSPPPTSPSPFTRTCPLPSPGPSFTCVGTAWVATSTVVAPSLTVPAGSTTVIDGNLTTDSVAITGASTTISVSGCIETYSGTQTHITVTLTQADLDAIETKSGKTLTTQLLSQSSTCNALSTASVSVDTSAIKSCKRIETDKVSNSAGLAATFSISSSKCNRWWIILVSVLCAVVVITIVVVVVVVSCSQRARHAMQPYSKRRTLRTTSSAPAVVHPGAAAESSAEE